MASEVDPRLSVCGGFDISWRCLQISGPPLSYGALYGRGTATREDSACGVRLAQALGRLFPGTARNGPSMVARTSIWLDALVLERCSPLVGPDPHEGPRTWTHFEPSKCRVQPDCIAGHGEGTHHHVPIFGRAQWQPSKHLCICQSGAWGHGKICPARGNPRQRRAATIPRAWLRVQCRKSEKNLLVFTRTSPP